MPKKETEHNNETLRFITLREEPDLMGAAADWFHAKWQVPREAYLACMEEYLSGQTEYGWYLCLHGGSLAGPGHCRPAPGSGGAGYAGEGHLAPLPADGSYGLL